MPILQTIVKHRHVHHPVPPHRLRLLLADLRRRPRQTTNQEVGEDGGVVTADLSSRLSDWLWSIWCDMGRDRSSNGPTCRIEKDASRLSISGCCSTSVSRDQNALYLST